MSIRNLRLHLLASRFVALLQRSLTRDLTTARDPAIFDVVFVTPPSSAPAWILDGICREVAQRLPGARTTLHALGPPLPPARHYFFSHFAFFIDSLRRLSPAQRARTYVFATHLEADKYGIPDALVAKLLARATRVFCMNEALLRNLAALGTPADRLTTLVGASSASIFKPHARTAEGKVGFCSAFYERKSPETTLEIVRAMPGRRFLLLGKGWRNYSRFAEFEALPNFEYVEADYRDYPAYYAQMSAFVSVSKKEGGPIPLIEAMMSNVVPVASHTGFAPDVIQHGDNGFLFPVGADVPSICALIDQAFALKADVRATVLHCDWQQYTTRIAREMNLPPSSMSREG